MSDLIIPDDLEGFKFDTAYAYEVDKFAHDAPNAWQDLRYRLSNEEMKLTTGWLSTPDLAIWAARNLVIGRDIDAKNKAVREAYLNSPESLALQQEMDNQRAKRIEYAKNVAPLKRRNLRPGTCDRCGKNVGADCGLLVKNVNALVAGRGWSVRCESCTEITHPQVLDAVREIDEVRYGAA